MMLPGTNLSMREDCAVSQLGRFTAPTGVELGPISQLFPYSRFSAGFSEKSARVFSQLPQN
jgi:hypothetical protein